MNSRNKGNLGRELLKVRVGIVIMKGPHSIRCCYGSIQWWGWVTDTDVSHKS